MGTTERVTRALTCRVTGCAVPAGLPELLILPGTSVPGYRLCRPFGTRLIFLNLETPGLGLTPWVAHGT